ncbi:heavy-metal-associated domain-containing protein [Hyphobacterium sp. CCMP332]|nr:heavy-metal-associated domain-containing protein [Hyphobacterium sp. CCMP332]
MPKYKFKSNIKCSNCEAQVRELLNTKDEIISFNVNLDDLEREVEIKTSSEIEESTIVDWVKDAGFQLKPKKSFLKKLFK